jgi:hypothetical protein
MSQKTKIRKIDIIQSADRYRKVFVDFEIPISDTDSVRARLSSPDIYSIQEERILVFHEKLAKTIEKGLDKLPMNEAKWEADLENATKEVKATLEKEKPKNLAEHIAYDLTRQIVVLNIIPKFLTDPETGEKLFPTEEEQKMFSELMGSNLELLRLCADQYVQLAQIVASITKTAKN